MIVFLLCLVIIYLSIVGLIGNIDYRGNIKSSFLSSTCVVALLFSSLYVLLIICKALVAFY